MIVIEAHLGSAALIACTANLDWSGAICDRALSVVDYIRNRRFESQAALIRTFDVLAS